MFSISIISVKQLKMGFFSEIKKLLFVKKSVAKSGMEKLKAEAEDTLDDVVEKGAELRERASDKIDNLVEAFTNDEAVDITDPDIPEASEKSTSETENTMQPEATTFTEEVGKRVIEGTEKLGQAALEQADDLVDKAEDFAESVGKKVIDGSETLKDKARDAVEYLDRKLDETTEKAKKLDAELKKNDQDGDGFADQQADLSKSTLDSTDDFFEKAKKFAEGKPMEDKTQLTDLRDDDVKKPTYKTYGFEDGDGDGNEIIDDAIIEEE